MNELSYWKQKLLQQLHDPVHKTLLLGGGGSHKKAAAELFRTVAGTRLRYVNAAPDRLAAGADRPMLGGSRECRVDWRQDPLMRHPLQPGVIFRVPGGDALLGAGARGRASELLDDLRAWWERAEEAGDPEGEPAGPLWDDVASLRALAFRLWRRMPEWSRVTGLPARLIPADSRCPDHALLDHDRIAAAACFVPAIGPERGPPAQQPCLVTVQIHGVQTFIAESRKTRDLWTASMIYGELVWAAMETVVAHYGPENVLYPDLLGNPFMDQWLLSRPELADAVPDDVRAAGARTASVPIPHTFTCLLPRGGAGHLISINQLMDDARDKVAERWAALCDATRTWLDERAPRGAWTRIWDRSMKRPPALTWTAVAWERRMLGQGTTPPKHLPALPGLRPDVPVDALPAVLQRRESALRPWIPAKTWEHYEHLRTVSWRVVGEMNQARKVGDWLGDERGFDYPLVHTQLLALQRATGLSRTPEALAEPGEKCSLTGRHEALSNAPAGDAVRRVGAARADARAFWEKVRGHQGTDRLGAPGALKRYLSRAEEPAFIARWNGVGQPPPREADRTAPYPSTAGLAAGPFLERVAASWPAGQAEVQRFLGALDKTNLDKETQHPRALPRLVRHTSGSDGTLRQFLCTEAQYLSLDVLSAERDRAKSAGDAEEERRLSELALAVEALLRAAADVPDEEVAVLFMDGDGISRLIEGDPEIIQTRWRDVLHPEALKRIEDTASALHRTGWMGLRDAKRAMGPSLHAMITRALADFTDRIAPWVVEVEFPGRLVYAGGDDLLALLPTRCAVAAAARLQQLFSAPYVVDTAPGEGRWEWRQRGVEGELGARAARRFLVPRLDGSGRIDPATWTFEAAITEAGDQVMVAPEQPFHELELLPMLGRASALSGGIAFGHFKTALGTLLETARNNLDDQAKKRGRALREQGTPRGHLSLSRFTGSGAKSTFTAPWSLGRALSETVDPGPPHLHTVLRALELGFNEGSLAARAPYQLREALETMMPVLAHLSAEPARRETLLSGLVTHTTGLERPDRPSDGLSLHDAVLATLGAGLHGESAHDLVSGLLIARHFASQEDQP